jgi:hypothetical protein
LAPVPRHVRGPTPRQDLARCGEVVAAPSRPRLAQLGVRVGARRPPNGVLEPAALSALDVENVRPHCAATRAHWRAPFDRLAEAVTALYGEEVHP